MVYCFLWVLVALGGFGSAVFGMSYVDCGFLYSEHTAEEQKTTSPVSTLFFHVSFSPRAEKYVSQRQMFPVESLPETIPMLSLISFLSPRITFILVQQLLFGLATVFECVERPSR